MAVIKAVSSKAPISTAIDYVSKDEKTENKLLSGYNITSPDAAMDEMQVTKEVWGKTGGRTYKHFVQSFAPDENITPEQAHEIATQFAEQCPLFKGFEVLIATHKDREHIHTHFVVNSVNFEDGHKFQMKSTELQDMKDLSDKLCRERGLTITRKGKTFHGEDREETTAYSKETYRLLQKAAQGKTDSYVQNIALAVLECREQATSREDFKMLMSERGYSVKWEDSRKHITFTDTSRQEHGEKKHSVRNNKLEQYYHIDFSKEGLEREFESNARKQAEQLREQSEQTRASDITRAFDNQMLENREKAGFCLKDKGDPIIAQLDEILEIGEKIAAAINNGVLDRELRTDNCYNLSYTDKLDEIMEIAEKIAAAIDSGVLDKDKNSNFYFR